jgi:hypothetical protein
MEKSAEAEYCRAPASTTASSTIAKDAPTSSEVPAIASKAVSAIYQIPYTQYNTCPEGVSL